MDEISNRTESDLVENLTSEQTEEKEVMWATVEEVTSDGVKLILQGETESGGKEYKANADVVIKAGDRVKITKSSGSYVVEYVLGAPMSRFPIPSGGTDGQVLTKDGATDYSLKWADGADSEYAEKLGTSSKYLSFSTNDVIPNLNGTYSLGNSGRQFKNLYVNNELHLGSSSSLSKIGFFGTTPIAKQTVSSSATVAQLITVLKNYGLIG